MDVAVGTDKRADVHAVAADIFHEIAEDREARDDLQFCLCAGRTSGKQHGNGGTDHQTSSCQHSERTPADPI